MNNLINIQVMEIFNSVPAMIALIINILLVGSIALYMNIKFRGNIKPICIVLAIAQAMSLVVLSVIDVQLANLTISLVLYADFAIAAFVLVISTILLAIED